MLMYSGVTEQSLSKIFKSDGSTLRMLSIEKLRKYTNLKDHIDSAKKVVFYFMFLEEVDGFWEVHN